MKGHRICNIFFPFVPSLVCCLFVLLCWSSTLAAPTESTKNRVRKIVSLSPAITEWLTMLELADEITGVTTYCNRPPGMEKKQKVGTIMEVDVEKIVTMKPDVILAMTLTNSKDLKKLDSLGIPVKIFPIPKDFVRLCEVFLDIGRAVNREEKARTLIEDARLKVSAIRKKAARLKPRKVFIQIGARPLYAASRDFFVNDYIEFTGGTNIFRDAGTGLISKEEVLKRNPDIIIIATMGISGESEKKNWQKFKTITAVQRGDVHILDADKICSPTPVTFAGFLREFAGIVHPGTGGFSP